ncbi:hypothetical protein EJ110_NYTH38321 [Nymphaea thermarum]|nr:hypothetical protein EJ110_NYTH38321 [Nymphaea thermarum]
MADQNPTALESQEIPVQRRVQAVTERLRRQQRGLRRNLTLRRQRKQRQKRASGGQATLDVGLATGGTEAKRGRSGAERWASGAGRRASERRASERSRNEFNFSASLSLSRNKDLGERDDMKLTVHRCQEITKFICNHAYVLNLMRKFTNGVELIRPAQTRFATNVLTVQCIVKQRSSLRQMFSSDDWAAYPHAYKRKATTIVDTIFDAGFWESCVQLLKICVPLVKVPRLVDSEDRPSIGYLYESMDRAKEAIRDNMKGKKKLYMPIWKIIDERWSGQLHRPLHATAYYLNPAVRYLPTYKKDREVEYGMLDCIDVLVSDSEEQDAIHMSINKYDTTSGTMARDTAVRCRTTMRPDLWLERFGPDCPELRKLAIRILSQTCSATGCERNWSVFQHIHSKKRNRLEHKRLNDLVYVRYNMKVRQRSQILNCDETPGIEEVYARVESEEQRRQVMHVDSSHESSPSAFVSRAPGTGHRPVRRCSHCNKLGHSVDFCSDIHPEKRLTRGRPPSSRRGPPVPDSSHGSSSSVEKSKLSSDQIKELQAYISRLSTTQEDASTVKAGRRLTTRAGSASVEGRRRWPVVAEGGAERRRPADAEEASGYEGVVFTRRAEWESTVDTCITSSEANPSCRLASDDQLQSSDRPGAQVMGSQLDEGLMQMEGTQLTATYTEETSLAEADGVGSRLARALRPTPRPAEGIC